MSSEDTNYTAHFFGPELIQKGLSANLIKAPIYLDGALVAPASGTVSVFNASNTAVIDAASVTITDSVAQYSIASASVASRSLEDDWMVEWTLAMPDGVSHVFRRTAALVRRRLYPVITDVDLIALHSDLAALRPATITSYQDYINMAWRDIIDLLREAGNFPQLVMSPTSLRRVHIYLTLELIARDFSTSFGEGSKWDLLADTYAAKFEGAFGRLNFVYDSDDDGDRDADRRAAVASIWLGIGTNRRGGTWPR